MALKVLHAVPRVHEAVTPALERLRAAGCELAMWAAIAERAAEVAGNHEVKVLVLRGATPEAFAAGADIGEFEKVYASAATARAYHRLVHAAYDAIAFLEKPTIAMVQGVCFGGGCALALCCDLRYADDTATFCIPPARLGLAYSLAETKRLVDLVGRPGPRRC